MPGPWDEYKPQAKKMPWEEFKPKKEVDTPSTAADFVRGVGQGASFGFGDELVGAVGGVLDPQNLSQMVEQGQQSAEALRQQAGAQDPTLVAQQMKAEGFSDEEIAQQLSDLARFGEAEGPTTYGVYRDRARRLQEEAGERSPIATTLGEMTGAVGTGLITGAAKLPALAAEGALYGFGGAEGSAKEQLASTALGGATGGLFGLGSKGAGKLFKKGKDALARGAERQAVKSLKPTTAQMKDIFDEQRMGRALLDEKVPQALRGPGKMAEKARKAENKLGDQLDDAYDAVGGEGVSRSEIANRILDKADALDAQATGNKPIVKKMRDFADDFLNRQDGTLKPKRLREERQSLDKVTDFKSDAPTQQANQALRTTFREAEEEAFSAQGLGEKFIDQKKKFMDISDAAKILDRSSAREKAGTMTELIKQAGLGGVTGLGYQTDNPYLVAAGILGAGGRKFGRGGAAQVLDRLSKVQAPNMVPAINRMVQSQNPWE